MHLLVVFRICLSYTLDPSEPQICSQAQIGAANAKYHHLSSSIYVTLVYQSWEISSIGIFAQPDSYPSLVLICQIFTLLVGQCGQCESLSSNQGLMLGIFTITLDPLSTYQDSGLQCNKLGPSYDELWPRTGHSPQLGCEIHGCATWNLVNSCCHVSHYISFLAFTEANFKAHC